MERILVVLGHPDPEPGHLCRALADAYVAGAREAGHEVRRVDVSALDFPVLRKPSDFWKAEPHEALMPAVEGFRWAEHVVLVFPLWHGMLPAYFKAFLEQVLRPGLAYEETGRFPRGLFGGRSARIVVTMAMPASFYRLWYHSHGVKALEHNMLRLVGIKRIHTTMFGMADSASEAIRSGWLGTMAQLGRNAH